ncbi:hypothetical protein H4219_004667 [Mycoemilia scoparia]|uniref:Uncharacterized protein n=1 Tax=Mycoemilia scoparia TaxID=417184 RepID=A0A9W7ZWL3_9FUNG|nr:hypothetical protein H4219_004667 [Mycoemilia scoparia]
MSSQNSVPTYDMPGGYVPPGSGVNDVVGDSFNPTGNQIVDGVFRGGAQPGHRSPVIPTGSESGSAATQPANEGSKGSEDSHGCCNCNCCDDCSDKLRRTCCSGN